MWMFSQELRMAGIRLGYLVPAPKMSAKRKNEHCEHYVLFRALFWALNSNSSATSTQWWNTDSESDSSACVKLQELFSWLVMWFPRFIDSYIANVVEIGKLRERERKTHTQQVSDEGTYLREPVFFPFSSDV